MAGNGPRRVYLGGHYFEHVCSEYPNLKCYACEVEAERAKPWASEDKGDTEPDKFWLNAAYRRKLACVGLCEDDTVYARRDGDDPWDWYYIAWYDGVAECVEREFCCEDRELRTAVVDLMYTSFEPPEGWEVLAKYRLGSAADCPNCGPGTEWDESDEQTLAGIDGRVGMATCTGYQGDPECPLCEGGGYAFLGEGMFEIVMVSTADVDVDVDE